MGTWQRQCDASDNFLLEPLGPVIHVDVTLTHSTYLNIAADHVHPFIETVMPDGCGLFQQDNAPCHRANMDFPDLKSIVHV